jgi:S-formylglutathione hydrolase FrmB
MTRRALLIGGASVVLLGAGAAAGVEAGILPGRSAIFRTLGLNGSAGQIPNNEPGPAVSGSFISTARLGKSVGWAVSYPPGSSPGDALPVLIALHGFEGNHTGAFGHHLGLDHFLADAVANGATPFAIASVDGGNSYWHLRATGEDAGAMVTDELIPLLKTQGLDTSRVAFFGWSMGAFGALHLAARLGAERVASVVAESPALWPSASRTPEGAFDSAADFDANTPLGRQSALAGIPIRIDCGLGDAFYPTARDYAAAFAEHPAGEFSAGAHDLDYWRRMAPAELEFVASHFA